MVEGIFSTPVVSGDHIVLELAVVLAFGMMTPRTVTGSGFKVDVVIVGVFVGAFVVERYIYIALPDQIFNHRLGFDDLLNTCQIDRLGFVAIGQRDLPVLGCF